MKRIDLRDINPNYCTEESNPQLYIAFYSFLDAEKGVTKLLNKLYLCAI